MFLITQENQEKYALDLAKMHILRKQIFKEKRKWPVRIINGMEIDQFDTTDAIYLIHKSGQEVTACARLIPTTKHYLLGSVYHDLVETIDLPQSEKVWEITRFCADPIKAPKNIMGLLLTSIMEFGLQNGIEYFVSIADIRTEPLIKRAGWFAERLGKTLDTGTEIAVAQKLDVSEETFLKMCQKLGSYSSIYPTQNTKPIKKVA